MRHTEQSNSDLWGLVNQHIKRRDKATIFILASWHQIFASFLGQKEGSA